MQERKPGCICELDKTTGEPLVASYGECPYHKPDAVTPKDTAEILVDKFMDWASQGRDGDDYKWQKGCAKQCALIAADEILGILATFQNHEYAKVLIPYYKEVKEEISKL